MKRKRETKKAISLIVLVITIIVMIILASAIIITLSDSEVIVKAKEAVEATNVKQVQQVAELAWADAYASGATEVDTLKLAVDKAFEDAKIDVSKYEITVTTKGVTVEYAEEDASNIPEEWKASVTAIVDEVPIPKGFVASPYGADGDMPAENKKETGLVIYELDADEIAAGATTLKDGETHEYSLRNRNQYVWVPVDKATFDTTFVRKDYINSTSNLADTLGTSSKYWEVIPTTELSADSLQYMTEDTLKEVKAMYESVRKYGGFYIARYEVGIDVHRKATGSLELIGINKGTKVNSVMGKIPYTYTRWTAQNVMNVDTKGAVEISRRMYPEDNANYGVVSTLTYGVQWDRTVQWFIDTEAMTLNQVNKTEGSTAFGNYSNSEIEKSDLNDGALVWDYSTNKSGTYVSRDSNTLTYPKTSGTKWALSTGALKAANINNIYDMAGNMREWTMEGCTTSARVYRGGYFGSTGIANPVANRYGSTPITIAEYIGFRPSLYIK